MATANDVLAVARGEIGVTEYPPGSNNVKYNTEYYGRQVYGDDAYPWCMVFVWWVFKHAGASSLFFDGAKTASCPTYYRWASKTGRWYTSGYKPGDVVIFRFSSSGYDHVGIVETANSDGSYTTIEGNTSLTNDDNGGAVMRRTRYRSQIVGAYRPEYGTAAKTVLNGCDVSEWQSAGSILYGNYDFAIIRSSYGLSADSECASHVKKVRAAGKLFGFYHYAHPEINAAEKEAKFFVSIVRPYLGQCILALDYEGKALNVGPKWARQWLDTVYDLTGVRPLIYLQGSAVKDYQEVLDSDYGLWVAHWGVSSPSYKPWPFWAIWQYSDSNGKLDVDYFNGTEETWKKYTAQKKVEPEPEPEPTPEPEPEPAPEPDHWVLDNATIYLGNIDRYNGYKVFYKNCKANTQYTVKCAKGVGAGWTKEVPAYGGFVNDYKAFGGGTPVFTTGADAKYIAMVVSSSVTWDQITIIEAEEDDEDMTQEKFNEMFMTAMKEYRKSLQDNDAGEWSAGDRQWAIANGLFIGSGNLPDGQTNYAWDDFFNRQQAAAVFHRFYDKFVK